MSKVPRNVFDLSHDKKLTCDMGKLIPIYLEEIIPGDMFKVSTSLVVRLTPLLAPIMHRVDVFTHFFFVPNRLVWTDWEAFITGGPDADDASVWPHRTIGEIPTGTLFDYLGIPTDTPANSLTVSMLPVRGMDLIWNEWYRDQNLQDKLVISKASGADATTEADLLTRCWEKDYFTCSLPWAQRGDPVSLPLGDSAPVIINPASIGVNPPIIVNTGTGNPVGNSALGANASGELVENGVGTQYSFDPNGTLLTDLATATAASVADIRQAVTIQQWLEKTARGGARYVESILENFGVRSSDARLARPEFLGGGRSPIVVSEVLQTSSTDGTTPQGNMAGHGFSLQVSHGFKRSFEEHGYVIGLMSIMPRTAYQQGVPRHFSRETRYDYPWPIFANIGEQAVLNKEIYADGDADPVTGDEGVFGYQGRYDELRHRESTVHGLFKEASAGGGLDFWHMGRIFASRPTLSDAFVTCDPTTRIFATPGEHGCLVHLMHNVQAVRPIPIRSEPGLRRF